MKQEDKHETQTIGSLLQKLNSMAAELGERKITDSMLHRAINKLPNWFEIRGVNHKNEKLVVEAKKIGRFYSDMFPISSDLYNQILEQYRATRDLISVPEIVKEENLPERKVREFIRLYKNETLADYLGVNIFLNSRYAYVPARKEKGFIDGFFKWMLGEFATFEGRLLNLDTNLYENFYVFEEIKAGNSKKGRILGFYKESSSKICAICGFYDGRMKYLSALKRSSSQNVSPKFTKYKSKDRPVVLSFNRLEVMDRHLRNYFNVLLVAWRFQPVKIIYGGDKYRVLTKSFGVSIKEIMPNTLETKNQQRLKRRNYGNLTKEEIKSFLNDHVVKDYPDQKKVISNFKEFLSNHTPNPDYISEYDDTLEVSSNTYPVIFWVSKKTKESFERLGVSAGLPPQFLLEFWLENWSHLDQELTDDQLLDKLNMMMGYWMGTTEKYLQDWRKIWHTSNDIETLKKVNGVLKGRINPPKSDKKSKKSNDYDDEE